MINLKDYKYYDKLINFLGLSKKVVLKNNYLLIKTYDLNSPKNVEKFIEEKLEESLGNLEDVLIDYKIFKFKDKRKIVVYILKNNIYINDIFSKRIKVNVVPIQFKISNDLVKKIGKKDICSLAIFTYENKKIILALIRGILVNFNEFLDIEEVDLKGCIELLEEITSLKVKNIYISKDFIQSIEETIKKENLEIIGV